MSRQRQRWVFSDREQDKYLGGPFAIINDITWYMDNGSEVRAWLDQCTPGWELKGVVIEFAHRDHLTMFKLRWS